MISDAIRTLKKPKVAEAIQKRLVSKYKVVEAIQKRRL